MSDRNKRPTPQVQVIRRGPGGPGQPSSVVTPTPLAPKPAAGVSPAPVTPKPTAVVPTGAPKPIPVPRASPSGAPPLPRASALPGRAPDRSAPRAFRPGPSNRPPPTAEQIAVLARKERVPNRIAKGELEGKMKCRIWKKLHAEEAKRFDQAWTLVEQNPKLDLADAFGVVQSGLPIEEFMARRVRTKKRAEVKEARAAVARERIDEWVNALIASKTELTLSLAERTVLDVMTVVQPVSFELERSGKVDKLQVVIVTRKATWDAVSPAFTREPKLTQKPAPVARQPARRPVNDPRVFLDHVGKAVRIELRNGLGVSLPLLAVGPYDVLVGAEGSELFIPLHGMMSWAPVADAS